MLNYYGIIMGIFVLILTGLGHVFVIKGEYYFGIKIWILFLIIGILGIVFSLLTKNIILSGFLGILAFTFLWGILEVFKQRKRVANGWFPKKK
ncbi:DUF4491 family protein [Clostridium tyrobutyricum]|uniref:DUF4491 family protein n=1 Tax=Clostridium tyrobutyricum TaxID=1519 RepID=UPI001C382C30|nr:DUF4491 family protein [Clostridium tyrobutyricum]MBV4427023.1 DUF4491 family protein [Clostridium tyrobutyricum]MBV4443687.1 DUF4491 family protein [Clostridium tyrobutyricum]